MKFQQNSSLNPIAPSKEKIEEAVKIDCLNHLSKAYKSLRKSNYKAPNDETSITAKLFDESENLQSSTEFKYTITPERVIFTKDIREGKTKAKTARKFDLCFQNWNTKNKFIFGIEAKLLIENNFKKRNAAILIKEYVSEKGMSKFINGIYEERGCMVGYILEGSIVNILTNINSEVIRVYDKAQCLIKNTNKKLNHDEIYTSNHKGKLEYDLYHLILNFV